MHAPSPIMLLLLLYMLLLLLCRLLLHCRLRIFILQAGLLVGVAREQAALAQQRMDELIAQGQEFGQTIGDAFFRVAEGTMTAKQAMAELVRMFAQMAAQGVFRQIGGAVGGAFAPTQTQNLANVGGVQPGITGGTPGGG